MQNLLIIALSGALCLAAMGCAQPPAGGAPAREADVPPASEPTDSASCAAQGGSWQPVGMMAVPACVLPYPDAGKVCTDSAECAGACWSDEALAPERAGGTATGRCQPTNMPFGCHSEVLKGVVQPGLCAD